MILTIIKKHLMFKLKTKLIKIYNDSPFHKHTEKGLTHLRIIIVSNDFTGQKLINRHRIVFSILSEIFTEKIYSLTLNTYTVYEWENKKFKHNNNVKCLKKSNNFY